MRASGEEIPDYDGHTWNAHWDQVNDAENYGAVRDLPVWHFYRAAALHRTYVLRDLLPKYGLAVN